MQLFVIFATISVSRLYFPAYLWWVFWTTQRCSMAHVLTLQRFFAILLYCLASSSVAGCSVFLSLSGRVVSSVLFRPVPTPASTVISNTHNFILTYRLLLVYPNYLWIANIFFLPNEPSITSRWTFLKHLWVAIACHLYTTHKHCDGVGGVFLE